MRIIKEEYEQDPQLVEDIQEERNKNLELLDEVRQILIEEEFEEERKLNGVAFTKTFDINGLRFTAQFYVDTTTFDYSTYVQEERDERSANYTSKGKVDNLVIAAKRFVFEISGI